jgi:hypothetical protein
MVKFYLGGELLQVVQSLLFGPQKHCDLRQHLPLLLAHEHYGLMPAFLLDIHSSRHDFLAPLVYLSTLLPLHPGRERQIVQAMCAYVRQVHAGRVEPCWVVEEAAGVLELMAGSCPQVFGRMAACEPGAVFPAIQAAFFTRPYPPYLQFDLLSHLPPCPPTHELLLSLFHFPSLLPLHLPGTLPQISAAMLSVIAQKRFVLEWA